MEQQGIPVFSWHTAEDPLGAVSAHMLKFGHKPERVICHPADLSGIRARLPDPITVVASKYVQRTTLYIEVAPCAF